MYRDLNTYLREQFGEKVYKLALSGGMGCPNRDPVTGQGGCVFCSAGGSGEFAPSAALPIPRQLKLAKERVAGKYKGHSYIAYFQSYTNTYAPVPYLEHIFSQTLEDPEVVALSIGTRPDCLGKDVLSLLERLRRRRPVWIELGLQTANEEIARQIHRGYELSCFEKSVQALKKIGVTVVVHVILGLPNESKTSMIETVEYLNQIGIDGIKLQLLHVLKGTELEKQYSDGAFRILELPEYVDILAACIEHLSPSTVVHRLTGDGPKKLLIAPLWSADKKRVWNAIQFEFARRPVLQGRLAGKECSYDPHFAVEASH